jgi:hypothetical protein
MSHVRMLFRFAQHARNPRALSYRKPPLPPRDGSHKVVNMCQEGSMMSSKGFHPWGPLGVEPSPSNDPIGRCIEAQILSR